MSSCLGHVAELGGTRVVANHPSSDTLLRPTRHGQSQGEHTSNPRTTNKVTLIAPSFAVGSSDLPDPSTSRLPSSAGQARETRQLDKGRRNGERDKHRGSTEDSTPAAGAGTRQSLGWQ